MPLRQRAFVLPFLAFTLLSFLISPTFSAPSPPNLVYPIQAQRPPVARVNATWTWTLLADTFNASSGSIITLSSRSLPAWATFDASTYTFSGMPAVGDEGSQYVTVQANASGVARGTSDGFVLLVVDTPAPTVKLSIAAQLPSASSLGGGATFTGDGALRVPPTWSFSLGFQQYTFESPLYYTKIYYTAYETGTTELPSWLTFDNNTVTFNGVAPQATGEYSVSVFGSDHYGYGDVEQVFKIAIGYHTLALAQPLPALNTTPSDQITYTIPTTGLLLDNTTIAAANLTSVQVTLTNLTFLTYAATTRTISGTVPSTFAPSNTTIPVLFTDAYGDTVATNITLNVVAALFTSSVIPTLTVYTGQAFKDDLSAYATSTEANYTAIFLPTAAQQWLSFDSITRVLSGTPPATIPSYQNATVSLAATDLATGVTSTASLLVAVAIHASTTTTASSSSASASPTGALQGAKSGGVSEKRKLAIGLSVGLLLGALLLLLLLLCWKRSKDEERPIQRDSSVLAFSQATIAAAQKATPGSSKWTQDTPGSKFTLREQEKAAQYWSSPQPDADAGANGDDEARKKTMVGTDSAEMDAAAAVAGAEAASKPKRVGLMGLFKGGTPKKEVSQISLPMSQDSLYGLGIGDNQTPDRIVVTKVPVAPPRRMDSVEEDPFANHREGSDELERSSSWESGGSSSLFYSDASDNEGRRAAVEGRRPRGPPSEPRQRRDFLPLPLRDSARSPTPDHVSDYHESRNGSGNGSASGSGSGSGSGGIRLVNSHSSESGGSFSSGGFDSYPVMPQHIRDSFDDPRRQESLREMPEPRLIPFTSARRTPQTSVHDLNRPSSQQAFRNPNRNSAIEDAEEGGRGTPNSGLYAPPDAEGSPTTSAVLYSTPREVEGEWRRSPRSPAESAFSEPVRLVPSTRNSPIPPPLPSTPRSYQHRRSPTGASSTYGDPIRIPVTVNELFRFTPSMNPAPFVSITSSPGRGGPPRATYVALIDSPENPSTDRQPLPDWLHFDQNSLEMWGQPRRKDIGALAVLVMERKDVQVPGSPKRGGGTVLKPERIEQVVSRFVLEVGYRTESGVGDDDAQLQVIQY